MQSEITVQVLNTLQNVCAILEKEGFILTERFTISDAYYAKEDIATLRSLSYANLLSRSFIVREINGKKVVSQLLYKKKTVDEAGRVIGEEKYKSPISSARETKNILNLSGLTPWCELINHSYVYRRGNMELALQQVDDLGLFIEYECTKETTPQTADEALATLIANVTALPLSLGSDYFCKKPYMFLHKK